MTIPWLFSPTTTRLCGYAVLALVMAIVGSCSRDSIVGPSGSSLTLTTPTKSVSANGTAVITAELRSSSGQPIAGATIAFSATLGTIAPTQAVTNGAGQATAVFSAGNASGTPVVSASSGSVQGTPVSLIVGSAAVGRVALTASPASVPFGGGNTMVTAVVTDAAGNPLKSMPVAFTTTTGNLTPANAKTDTNGIVQTTLTTAASAVVTAVAGVSPPSTGAGAPAALTGSLTISVAGRPSPVVSILASGPPVANAPITFTMSAMPAPGTNTTIQNVTVSFGDGGNANLGAVSGAAITAQHVYAAGGTYTVSMTATDSAGGSSTASTVIFVQASAPLVVSVVAGPMVPAGGGPNAIVTLTATVIPATAVISGYTWDFGDGGPGQQTTGGQIQHVFARTGLYTVTVTAAEALTGLTANGTVPVSTASGMPTVSINAGANPIAGRPLAFTLGALAAAGSNAAMQSVRVTFGDGTAPVELGGVSGSAINAGHIYAAAGTYLVSVTATDTAGGTATAATQVIVGAPNGPSVSVSASPNPVSGAATTFTIGAIPPAGTSIQNIHVTFGDGSAPVDLGSVGPTATTQHVYAAGGSYNVSVTATDSGGGTGTASTDVVIGTLGAPSVSVTAGASSVAGSPTSFTVTAAAAAGSGATIQNVRVTFGDGSAPVDLGAVSTATTQHVYAASGSFTVSAVATDSGGRTATASTQVVVGALGAPSVSVSAGASSIAGSPTTFTVTAAAASGATIQNVRVTFGDGSAPVDLGAVGGTATTQHVYPNSGSFTVSAVATDNGGRTATASTQVVVGALGAPSVSVSASASSVAGSPTTFTIAAAAASGATIQNVRVTFGDGSAPVDLGAVSGTATTQHVYATSGSFTVSAVATDSGSRTATASTQVSVATAGAPSVSVTASANPIAGTPTTFTITAAPAPGRSVTIQNVQVNYGDNTPPVDLGAVTAPIATQHVFAASGTYTVSATATDSGGATAAVSIQLIVAARPTPTVSISANANPIAGRAVTFTISATPAPGGNNSIQNVTLEFGDGAATSVGAVSGSTTTQHVYGTPGTYTVSATATDSSGSTAVANTTVVVVAAATAQLTINGAAQATVPFQFTATVQAATGVTFQSVVLRYGDGAQDDLGQVGVAPVVRSHTYSLIGTFRADLIVTIAGGPPPVTATATVVVGCPPYNHTFSISSTVQSALHAWPGGDQTFAPVAGCSVTIRAPTGTISNLSGDGWAITGSAGYLSCSIFPQSPDCGGVGSSSSILNGLRPYCSNAAATVFDRTSTANLLVQCVPR